MYPSLRLSIHPFNQPSFLSSSFSSNKLFVYALLCLSIQPLIHQVFHSLSNPPVYPLIHRPIRTASHLSNRSSIVPSSHSFIQSTDEQAIYVTTLLAIYACSLQLIPLSIHLPADSCFLSSIHPCIELKIKAGKLR